MKEYRIREYNGMFTIQTKATTKEIIYPVWWFPYFGKETEAEEWVLCSSTGGRINRYNPPHRPTETLKQAREKIKAFRIGAIYHKEND